MEGGGEWFRVIGLNAVAGGCGGPPPENFEISDALRWILKHFQARIQIMILHILSCFSNFIAPLCYFRKGACNPSAPLWICHCNSWPLLKQCIPSPRTNVDPVTGFPSDQSAKLEESGFLHWQKWGGVLLHWLRAWWWLSSSFADWSSWNPMTGSTFVLGLGILSFN